MSHSLACSILVAMTACGTVVDDPDTRPDAGHGADATGTTARCNQAMPFGAPTLLANVNTADGETAFALTGDELTAFVSSDSDAVLAIAQRTAAGVPFGAPTHAGLATINDEDGLEVEPAPTADGSVLYFVRYVADSTPQLFTSGRDDTTAPFAAGIPVTVDGSNLAAQEIAIARDARTLYWVDNDASRLHAATRQDTHDRFAGARDASTISASDVVVSADELTLYYADSATDILRATRASTTDTFGTGVPVGNVNSPELDAPVFVTADDCVLYLKSTRPGGPGGYDLWEARRAR